MTSIAKCTIHSVITRIHRRKLLYLTCSFIIRAVSTVFGKFLFPVRDVTCYSNNSKHKNEEHYKQDNHVLYVNSNIAVYALPAGDRNQVHSFCSLSTDRFTASSEASFSQSGLAICYIGTAF